MFPVSGDIPAASAEDVEIAVEAARRAFSKPDYWASTSGSCRAKFLRAIADKVFDFLSLFITCFLDLSQLGSSFFRYDCFFYGAQNGDGELVMGDSYY